MRRAAAPTKKPPTTPAPRTVTVIADKPTVDIPTTAKERFLASMRASGGTDVATEIFGSASANQLPTQVLTDLQLIDELLTRDEGDAWEGEHGFYGTDANTNLYEGERDAFADMRERLNGGRALSEKQRAWVHRAAERLGVAIPSSAAPVPRGREVAPAPALRTLPLAPPGRNSFAKEGRVMQLLAAGAPGAARLSAMEAFIDEKIDPDKADARAIYAATPDLIEALALLLGVDEFKLRKAYVKAAQLDAHRVLVKGPDGEERRVLRTALDGPIHNCAVAAGESPTSCQMCAGDCPDLFGREQDDQLF